MSPACYFHVSAQYHRASPTFFEHARWGRVDSITSFSYAHGSERWVAVNSRFWRWDL